MTKVKVLTLGQPWAELVVMGVKKIETRAWQTRYRGELYIHSSGRLDFNDMELRHTEPNFKKHLTKPVVDQMKCGYIIGKVELYGMEETNDPLFIASLSPEEKSFGDYRPKRFGWLLRNAVKFKNPIETKGALSIWEYDITGHCIRCGFKSDRISEISLCANCQRSYEVAPKQKAPLHSYYHEEAERQHRNQQLK